MHNDAYEEWNICGGLRGVIELISFTYNESGVELLIESHEKKAAFSIGFEDRVLSFRYADEGNRIKFIENISDHSINFYISYDSEYLDWFINQNYEIRNKESLVHYVIATNDDVIDIIDSRMSPPPVVKRREFTPIVRVTE